MSLKILASDTVTSSMRVNESSFQNQRLEVSVHKGDSSSFRLLNIIEFEIFRQVNDLRPIEADMDVLICLHLFVVDSDEEFLIIDIP